MHMLRCDAPHFEEFGEVYFDRLRRCDQGLAPSPSPGIASIAFAAGLEPDSAEVGVYTFPAFRGRGYAAGPAC